MLSRSHIGKFTGYYGPPSISSMNESNRKGLQGAWWMPTTYFCRIDSSLVFLSSMDSDNVAVFSDCAVAPATVES